MSLWERVSADDLSTLGIAWLLLCAVVVGLYVWAARRWEQYRRGLRQ